jgi:two-component system, OmpR family, response regulator CpxR
MGEKPGELPHNFNDRQLGLPASKQLPWASMGRYILVIDDDAELRLMLRRGLEGLGFHVIEAASGVGCAESLRERNVAAVICDIFMPRKEGFATIVDIREVAPQIPIIAMTGREPRLETLKIACSMGADRTLAKPFTVGELCETLAGCGVSIPHELSAG